MELYKKTCRKLNTLQYDTIKLDLKQDRVSTNGADTSDHATFQGLCDIVISPTPPPPPPQTIEIYTQNLNQIL